MGAQIRPAIVSLVVLSVVMGLAYPAFVTAIAQVVFPRQANGSLIVKDGKTVGSTLIGQPFDDPKYFWGPRRPRRSPTTRPHRRARTRDRRTRRSLTPSRAASMRSALPIRATRRRSRSTW
jgi:K+-transporting ATPase c subunit